MVKEKDTGSRVLGSGKYLTFHYFWGVGSRV